MIKLNKDGFVIFSDLEDARVELNLEHYRNEFSPFSGADRIQSALDRPLIVDGYYGQVYDHWVGEADSIYGKTEELPEYSGDSLSNYGFLRVPFRRVPRRLIHTRRELESIVKTICSADSDLKLLFRGQNKEYLLNRAPETLNTLYGDSEAIEPSLLPSASRRGVALEVVFPEWCSLLQIFMGVHRERLASQVSKTTLDSVIKNQSLFLSTYNFGLFALAVAQHYGLPSSGLDVTKRLDVALFFALTEFAPSPYRRRFDICKRKSSRLEPAVIYLFAVSSRFQLDYDEFMPKGFPMVRPDAQSAHFMLTGWGLSKNSCARRLFLALYLDPEGDFGDIPSTDKLFPAPQKDPFGEFLETVAQKPLPDSIRMFVRDFRWVSHE